MLCIQSNSVNFGTKLSDGNNRKITINFNAQFEIVGKKLFTLKKILKYHRVYTLALGAFQIIQLNNISQNCITLRNSEKCSERSAMR